MADDPFQFFRKTMEAFESSGSQFDPAAVGTFGWPMTPLPLQGMGNTAMTPEAGTKRAVTQLYEAIEALEETPFDSESLPQQWMTRMTPEQFTPPSPEQFGNFLGRTYQLWLANFTQLLIENYTVRLLHDDLVVDSHQNKPGTYEWLITLSQSEREQLLRRCTTTDGELVNEMTALRNQRNELLYSLGTEEGFSLTDPVTDAQRYIAVLEVLEESVGEDGGYDFLSSISGESDGETKSE